MRQMKRCRAIAVVGVAALVSLGCAEQRETDKPPAHPGMQTYVNYCASCHNAGVAEAPKLGDAEQWELRLKKGRDALVQNTIDGMPPAMPKKGLCLSCSDEELADAVDYMLSVLNPADN